MNYLLLATVTTVPLRQCKFVSGQFHKVNFGSALESKRMAPRHDRQICAKKNFSGTLTAFIRDLFIRDL